MDGIIIPQQDFSDSDSEIPLLIKNEYNEMSDLVGDGCCIAAVIAETGKQYMRERALLHLGIWSTLFYSHSILFLYTYFL